MNRSLNLKSLAKINLGLDVLGRRENGYHDVRMVMQTIYLYDNVTLNKTEEAGIQLKTNLPYLPVDDNNIAYKAAKMLVEEFNIKEGVEIILDKHIPVAAGMAGGSSNAAAGAFVSLALLSAARTTFLSSTEMCACFIRSSILKASSS